MGLDNANGADVAILMPPVLEAAAVAAARATWSTGRAAATAGAAGAATGSRAAGAGAAYSVCKGWGVRWETGG